MQRFAHYYKPLLMLATAGILLFSAYLAFFRLGAEPLQDYDEATYGEVTSESLAHGNYLTLTFLNNLYFRKPPLLFWMTTTAEKLIPDAEYAMRLPSALAAFLLIPLVGLICLEVGAGGATAVVAMFILATTSAAMEPARQARFDVLISFFIVAAFYAGMRALRKDTSRVWYLAMGASIALAVLTKNVIAVFAPVALLIYFFQRVRFQFLRDPWFWGGVGMFVLVAAPWHIYESILYGHDFWHNYIGTQVIERAQSNLFVGTNSPTNADYVRYFLAFGAPWSLFFCVTALVSPFVARALSPKLRAGFIAALGTVIAIAVVMLISHTKAVTYLIPLYPFMAVALALTAYEGWNASPRPMRSAFIVFFALASVSAAQYTMQNVFHTNPYYSLQYGLAAQEYQIAQIINERAKDPILYTYTNDNLGTIQYYTRLPFTATPYVYLLESAPATIPADAFVLTTKNAADLSAAFPQYTFTPLYTGSLLSLFAVAS